VQLFGGLCEAERFRNGDEVAQMTKFHRAKTLPKATRPAYAKNIVLPIMTNRSPTGRRPYLKGITCYQEDIGRPANGGVSAS
jgi:hypothetical protein